MPKDMGLVMNDDDEEVEASLGSSHSLLYVYNDSLLQISVKCVKLRNSNIYGSGNSLNNESSL